MEWLVALIPKYLVVVTTMLATSCMLTLFAPNLISQVSDLTSYGKTNANPKFWLARILAVPKKWFRHFYIFAVLWTSACLYLGWAFTKKQLKSEPYVPYFRRLTNKSPQIPFSLGMLVMSLVLFHVFRRCMETLFVSIYSSSTMNVGHYLLGLFHYALLPLSIACETLGFASKSVYEPSFPVLSTTQAIGIFLFFYANLEQNKAARYLRSCRTAADGTVSTEGHSICYGGWFDLVSCPHFLFEILIYVSLLLVLSSGVSAFKYVAAFVAINQVFAAQITHRWYKTHFKEYPAHRTAIIPYLL